MIEVGGAMALNKRLIPILLHVGPNELPDALGNGMARDINDIERYYAEVKARNERSTKEPEDAPPEKHSAEGRRTSQFRTFSNSWIGSTRFPLTPALPRSIRLHA
jgi:hypothetical protein